MMMIDANFDFFIGGTLIDYLQSQRGRFLEEEVSSFACSFVTRVVALYLICQVCALQIQQQIKI